MDLAGVLAKDPAGAQMVLELTQRGLRLALAREYVRARHTVGAWARRCAAGPTERRPPRRAATGDRTALRRRTLTGRRAPD